MPDRAFARRLKFELFSERNFCFCTTTSFPEATQRRSPTFYFTRGGLSAMAHGGGVGGRIRTDHSDGPLIEVTDLPRYHLFSRSMDKFRQIIQFEIGRNSFKGAWDDLSDIAAGRNPPDCDDRDYVSGQSSVRRWPNDGDYHFEFIGNADDDEYVSHHDSMGRVALRPAPTSQQIDKLLLRALEDGAKVELLGKTLRYLGTRWRDRDLICYDEKIYLDTL